MIRNSSIAALRLLLALGLLLSALWWTWIILWIWLMVMAWVRPDYRLPFISNWVRYFV